MPKATGKTGDKGKPPEKPDTLKDMFLDSDEDDYIPPSQYHPKAREIIASSSQSTPRYSEKSLEKIQDMNDRWNVRMENDAAEICGLVQVSDLLKETGARYSGRSKSVPPETPHGENVYYSRDIKLDLYCHNDLRRSRSQGDVCVGKYKWILSWTTTRLH